MKNSYLLLLLAAFWLNSCTSSQSVSTNGTYGQPYDATGNATRSQARVTTTGSNKKGSVITTPTTKKSKPVEMLDWLNMDLLSFFNDPQRVQLSAARVNGIEPNEDNSNFFPLIISGKVVKIESCDEYKLANLAHSYPYLVPKAADMLKAIGARVQEITGTKSRMLVTSCLRTVEKQMDLSETNQNAASYSCHYYGTTFDLAYNAAGELKGGISYETFFKALCQAVHEMREDGKLYVKYETGQHCLHMTVR